MTEGVCALTGDKGKFVRAHITPAALMEAGGNDGPLIQYGHGEIRAVRRWTSWYDARLVTASGESVLAEHDDHGIRELRRHKLIWSSWGPMMDLQTTDHVHLPFGDGFGIRQIKGVHPARLRLFFLSLLWRAAATRLREFGEIVVDGAELDLLRRMLLNGDPTPLHMFPVELIQISTRGFVHNQSPVPMEKTIPSVDGEPHHVVPIYRFYFDGLIVHFDRRADRLGQVEKMGASYVGGGDELTVTTVTYENSLQRWNIDKHVADEERARASANRGASQPK